MTENFKSMMLSAFILIGITQVRTTMFYQYLMCTFVDQDAIHAGVT